MKLVKSSRSQQKIIVAESEMATKIKITNADYFYLVFILIRIHINILQL